MVAATEAAPPQGEQPKGLFGRILGGGSSQKQFKKAKMGLENKFYYNKELNCWVMPGEEEAKRKELSQSAAPPTSSQNTDAEGPLKGDSQPQKTYNGGMSTKGVTSRYAAIPFGGSGTEGGSGNSVSNVNSNSNSNSILSGLSGLRPPLAGVSFPNGSGSGPGPGVFKPAVFKPAVEEPVQPSFNKPASEAASEVVPDANLVKESREEQPILRDTVDTVAGRTDETKMRHDPVVVEILSFWLYYRQQGYEMDAMTEWVTENYGPSYAKRYNYEEMLQDPKLVAEVETYIKQQNSTAAGETHISGVPSHAGTVSAPVLLSTHHEQNDGLTQQVGGNTEAGEVRNIADMSTEEQAAQYSSYYAQGNEEESGWEGFSLGPEAGMEESGGEALQAHHQLEPFNAVHAAPAAPEYPQTYETVDAATGWEGFSLGPEAGMEENGGEVLQAHHQPEPFNAVHAAPTAPEYPQTYETVDAATGWEGFSLGPEAGMEESGGEVLQAHHQLEPFNAVHAAPAAPEYPQTYETVDAAPGWEGWAGGQQSYQIEQNNESTKAEPSQADSAIDFQPPPAFNPVPLTSALLISESIGTLSSRGSLEQERFETDLPHLNQSEALEPAKIDDTVFREGEKKTEEDTEKLVKKQIEASVQTERVGGQEQGIQVGEGWESMVADLKARHEDLMEEQMKQWQAELQTIRQEAEREVEAVKQQVSDMENSHAAELEDLKAVLELKDDAIRSLQEDALRREEDLKTQSETLAAEQVASALADVRERIRVAVAEAIAEKDSELARMEEELRKQAEEDVAAVEADFRSALMEKDARIEQLEQQVRAKDDVVAQYSQLEEELRKQAEEDVAAVEADFRSALMEKDARIEQLEQQVRAKEVDAGRIKELERTVAVAKKKIQALRNEIESKDANIQALSEDLEAKSSLEADHAALAGLLAQRDAALESLSQEALHGREEISRYTAMLEEQEHALQSLHSALAAAETQLSQISSQFESTMEEERAARKKAEVEAVRLQEELELAEDKVRVAESEPRELRAQLAAASQVAVSKEEELRKYKLQLVKTRKLRTVDAEKVAALESRATEAEEGLGEALTALGQEEAKVARLSEILIELGLEPEEVEAEIAAVEEAIGFGREEGGGSEG